MPPSCTRLPVPRGLAPARIHRAALPATAALALTLAACAGTRPLRPLDLGAAVVTASLGGPMLQVAGVTAPTPILTVGGAYGLREHLALTAEVDLTAALYGVAHLAPGVALHPIVNDAGALPSLALFGAVHVLTNFEETRVAPQLTGVAVWQLGGPHLAYLGVDSAIAFGSPTRLIAGPLAGAELRFGRAGFGLELKWLAPQYDVEPTAPGWISPGKHGFFSVLLAFSYQLGGRR